MKMHGSMKHHDTLEEVHIISLSWVVGFGGKGGGGEDGWVYPDHIIEDVRAIP